MTIQVLLCIVFATRTSQLTETLVVKLYCSSGVWFSISGFCGYRVYCYFRLSFVVEITVFELGMVDTFKFAIRKQPMFHFCEKRLATFF